jgi:hypothetical protein
LHRRVFSKAQVTGKQHLQRGVEREGRDVYNPATTTVTLRFSQTQIRLGPLIRPPNSEDRKVCVRFQLLWVRADEPESFYACRPVTTLSFLVAVDRAWGKLNLTRDVTAPTLEQHVGTKAIAASLKRRMPANCASDVCDSPLELRVGRPFSEESEHVALVTRQRSFGL